MIYKIYTFQYEVSWYDFRSIFDSFAEENNSLQFLVLGFWIDDIMATNGKGVLASKFWTSARAVLLSILAVKVFMYSKNSMGYLLKQFGT